MTRNYISNRVQSVPPSGIRRFFDIAATMKNVISLGIGEPDFVTPEPILRAGLNSLNEGQNVEYELVTNRGKTSAENLKVA